MRLKGRRQGVQALPRLQHPIAAKIERFGERGRPFLRLFHSGSIFSVSCMPTDLLAGDTSTAYESGATAGRSALACPLAISLHLTAKACDIFCRSALQATPGNRADRQASKWRSQFDTCLQTGPDICCISLKLFSITGTTLCVHPNGSFCYLSFSGWLLLLFLYGPWKKLAFVKSLNSSSLPSLRVGPSNTIWPRPKCESFKSVPAQITCLAG